MKIKDFGGEFALIEMIRKGIELDNSVKLGIGDDTAVLKHDDRHYLLFTTDSLVEGDHFSHWWKPEQVGMKAVEINVSDIAAMGGLPKHLIVALTLPDSTTAKFVRNLYKGIRRSCARHGVNLVGGNVTHGRQINIGISLLGVVEKDRLCLRSNARLGDLICVTGFLGGGRAGLELFLDKVRGRSEKYHLYPKAKVREGRIISEYSKCMIDISDGLASEVKHICDESRVGAVIYKEKIPIRKEVFADAKRLGSDPYDFALYGGEDFELVFTLSSGMIKSLRKRLRFSVVGRTLKKGVFLMDKNEKFSLGSGYDHFTKRC